ncbi:MAG TPA: hypothetical protein VF092_13700 [Longimicrobium sp.]
MESLRSIVIGTSGLAIGAVIALVLTLARGYADADEARLRHAVRLAFITIALQAGHFGEELETGFARRFPELLGLAPWPDLFFVLFNVFWLAIWTMSVPALFARRRAALFPLWFLGIAGVVNGIAHPLLAIRAGSYFPGLYTSPFVGMMAGMLLSSLAAITEPAAREIGRA